MLISVVNHTDGKLSDEAVQEGIRAVNRQIAHDFTPHWHMAAALRLEGAVGKDPDDDRLPELRGDAIIYLWNEVDVEDALGYHEANAAGIPFGFIFTELTKQLGEPWTVTLSHEALELIADPEVNLLVAGPHPGDPGSEVFHWYEMCDAVQDDKYKVDGVAVSNFVLPLYFTQFAEVGGRNDFLGRLTKGKPLQSFGINRGGYIGFYNPQTREHETFALKGDSRARERLKIKGQAQLTRRSIRYKLGTAFRKELESVTARAPRRRGPARAGRPTSRRAAVERRAVEMIDRSPLRSGPGPD
jgi:hypothetical protein